MEDLLLLSKDTPIAELTDGAVRAIIPARLPLFLQRTGDAAAWLRSRAIDGHRTNSRLLKRVLRLEHKDDLTTVLAVNAATITDNFWVRPLSGDSPRYDDIRFKLNLFDDLALTGDANSFDRPPGRTPELTNTGSFEKCWRLEDGAWMMYKAGRREELFSELFAYHIGCLLDIPMARYEASGDFIKSRDFTEGARVDFESAAGIIGDEADYIKIYEALRGTGKEAGVELAARYVAMCYFDGLVFNMDRHENNFGVLRSPETGDIISAAPLYDHNISLIARGYPNRDPGDMLIDDFAKLLKYIGEPFHAPRLTENALVPIALNIPYAPPPTDIASSPREFAARYILRRQDALEKRCGGLLRLSDADLFPNY
ncbi:MAG: HipA domain-containing protein [Oscillospiraceae bacterium]|jgi:hypothetical protein|nr:HipA domain-containing protein [Oscillospiraceae bacterium]